MLADERRSGALDVGSRDHGLCGPTSKGLTGESRTFATRFLQPGRPAAAPGGVNWSLQPRKVLRQHSQRGHGLMLLSRDKGLAPNPPEKAGRPGTTEKGVLLL